MNLSALTKQIKDVNMPVFWQIYSLVIPLLVTIVFFLKNNVIENILHPIIGLMICVSIAFGVSRKKSQQSRWYTLMVSLIFFEISITLQALESFGFAINPISILITKEMGVGLITSFIIGILLLIEERFKLKGLIIDITLIIIAVLSFVLIANPSYIESFIFEYDLFQQLYIVNIVSTFLILILGITHVVLSKRLELKIIIIIASICAFLIHYIIEFILSIHIGFNEQLLSHISWFFYQIVGSIGLLYIYLEDFKFDSYLSASRTSQLFMWMASILAILVVPIALLLYWYKNDSEAFYLFAGLSSLILGVIVIWRFIILVKDSNEQREQLLEIAFTDKLTGVLNYFGCTEAYSLKNNLLIIAINIEDFKSINDLYGRNIGDEVLKSLAKRLSQLEDTEIIARTGPDTFMIVYQLAKCDIPVLISNIQEHLGVWDYVAEAQIAVPLTYGASHSHDPIDSEILAAQAEKALKIARKRHLDYYLYEQKDSKPELPRQELRGILQNAVDDNFLPVHFQPIYNIEDGSLKALELLIRVHSKEHGLLLPGQFLEQAQAYGLLTSLTKVCVNMIARYYDQLPNVRININIPPYMLDNSKFVEEFLEAFSEKSLSPDGFCIEVLEDEDTPIDNLIGSVKKLKEKGFTIAMDDFGTGYSSLNRLSMLPFDTVKIDRSLLLAASSGNEVILDSSIKLIKRLGLAVVVEGVETLEQLSLVKRLGADSVQGFLFSKPVDASKAGLLPIQLESW